VAETGFGKRVVAGVLHVAFQLAPQDAVVGDRIHRDVEHVGERLRIRLRADLFNAFNRAQYGAPNADFSQVNFGTITTTLSCYATGRGTPREFQLSAKVSF